MTKEANLVQYLNPAVRSYIVNLTGAQDTQDFIYAFIELGYSRQHIEQESGRIRDFIKEELGRLSNQDTPTAKTRLVRLCETMIQFYLLEHATENKEPLEKLNAFMPTGFKFSPFSGRLLYNPTEFNQNQELLAEADYLFLSRLPEGSTAGHVSHSSSASPQEEELTEVEEEVEPEEVDEQEEESEYAEAEEAEAEETEAEDAELEEASQESDEETHLDDNTENSEPMLEAEEEEAEDFEEAEEAALEEIDQEDEGEEAESTFPPDIAEFIAELPEAEEAPSNAPAPELNQALDALAEVKNRRLKILKKLQTGMNI